MEDYRKIAAEKKGDTTIYSSQQVQDCMHRGTWVVEVVTAATTGRCRETQGSGAVSMISEGWVVAWVHRARLYF